MNTSGLILLSSMTLAGTTIAKQSRQATHPSYLRTVLASVGVGFFLSLVAAAADNVARALAWLVIVGAMVGNGSALLAYIGNLGK